MDEKVTSTNSSNEPATGYIGFAFKQIKFTTAEFDERMERLRGDVTVGELDELMDRVRVEVCEANAAYLKKLHDAYLGQMPFVFMAPAPMIRNWPHFRPPAVTNENGIGIYYTPFLSSLSI